MALRAFFGAPAQRAPPTLVRQRRLSAKDEGNAGMSMEDMAAAAAAEAEAEAAAEAAPLTEAELARAAAEAAEQAAADEDAIADAADLRVPTKAEALTASLLQPLDALDVRRRERALEEHLATQCFFGRQRRADAALLVRKLRALGTTPGVREALSGFYEGVAKRLENAGAAEARFRAEFDGRWARCQAAGGEGFSSG